MKLESQVGQYILPRMKHFLLVMMRIALIMIRTVIVIMIFFEPLDGQSFKLAKLLGLRAC